MQDGHEHIPFERLLAFVESDLPAEAEVDVQQHLDAGCDLCAGEIALIRREIGALRASAWPAPSAVAHRRAVMAFRDFPRKARPTLRRLRWTTALAGVAIVLLLVLASPLRPFGDVAYAASLAEIQGQVQVRLEASEPWTAASMGSRLPAGAEIRTGAGSQVVLVFPDGGRSLLSELTSVALEEIGRTDGQWRIAFVLLSGTTDNLVERDTSELRVRTTAGETVGGGSRFVVNADQNGTVVVDVDEGSVAMTDANGTSVQLSAGQSASFTAATGTPGDSSSTTPGPAATPWAGDGANEGDGQNNSGQGGEDGQSGGADGDQQDNASPTATP
jgi:hypothetical protein